MPQSDSPYNKVYEDELWDFWKIIAFRREGNERYYIAINFDGERRKIQLEQFPPRGWERISFDPFNVNNHE